MSAPWLALVIGNTRLHWGYFDQGVLAAVWHTCHLSKSTVDGLMPQPHLQRIWPLLYELVDNPQGLPPSRSESLPIPIWIASVVPSQTRLWTQAIPEAQVVERSRLPLKNIYPTLGIDRAINLLGAKQTLGRLALVIDSGTALTLTAGVDDSVYGGAIMPGVRLQLESLGQQTAELGALLPEVSVKTQPSRGRPSAKSKLPDRWARNSEGAIASGIAYGLTSACLDYITDWWQQFPDGAVILTGGDGPLLYQYLQQRTPKVASRVLVDSDLMFKGMQAYRSELTT